MALQADNIADLVATTLRELGDLKFTDITSDLQKHIALKRLMKKNKTTFDSGYGIQWDVMTDQNGSAQAVGLYATDNVNVPNVMTQGNIPWRHVTWNWAIERREIAMNRGARRIVDLIKTRRIAAFISATEYFEQRLWKCPAITDTLNPFGLPYYIVKNATEGFNGLVPSGYTTVGAISSTQYPRWANWTNGYTNVTKDDLIRKMRKAMVFTDFEPPVEGMPTFNTGDDMGIYTTYTVIGAMEELLESQNDDLGHDLASQDGLVTFRRTPMTWVPALEVDTTNPVYGVNWGEMKTVGLRGEWLNETMLPIQPGQHTVSANHVDCSFNWLTRNRRRHWVISNGTTMPA